MSEVGEEQLGRRASNWS